MMKLNKRPSTFPVWHSLVSPILPQQLRMYCRIIKMVPVSPWMKWSDTASQESLAINKKDNFILGREPTQADACGFIMVSQWKA